LENIEIKINKKTLTERFIERWITGWLKRWKDGLKYG
jgi:hypothetical protein